MVKPSGQLTLWTVELAPTQEWTKEWDAWHFLRVGSGSVYWLGHDRMGALNPTEVLAIRPEAGGTVRASSLGPAMFHWFSLNPVLLAGVLTVAESQFLTDVSRRTWPETTLLSADHPATPRFGEICAQAEKAGGLAVRVQMLALVAEVFGHDWPVNSTTVEGAPDATDRFNKMIHDMVEGELLRASPSEWARRCGCSLRHFSRLFRAQVGMSIRAKQTELRLQKARELLRTTNAKVIEVAYESGYQHLGLFNQMFKRRFGVTPTECRRQANPVPASRRWLRAGIALGLLAPGMALGLAAELAVPPAATNLTTQVPPPATTNLTFRVNGYRVEGNTLLSPEAVDRVLKDYTGPALGLDDIRRGVVALQSAYRARGYATVSVLPPSQKITNGVVRLVVTEGRLAAILVSGNHYFSSNNVQRALPSLRTNVVLNSHVLQAELDQANANRDRQIYPLLGPGAEAGTSTLTLDVKDRLPLHGRVELNNESTPGTPYWRANASLQYNNFWQHEHSFGVQYGFTPTDFKEEAPLVSRFYDVPLVATYSAYYRLPMGNPKALAEQLQANPRTFGYNEVTRQFQLPPATGRPELTWYASRATIDTGTQFSPERLVTQTATSSIVSQDSGRDFTTSANLGFRYTQPLPTLAKVRSIFSAGLDFKTFQLTSHNTNNFYFRSEIPDPRGPGFPPTVVQDVTSSPQPTRVNSVQYLPLTYRLDFSRPDPAGTTSLGVSHSLNIAGVFSDRQDFASLTGTRKSSGTWQAVNGEFSRNQRVYEGWSIDLRANGQWASEPLISNEQFGVGGHAGVRGYREGDQYGDLGWRGLFEPQTPLFNLGNITGDKLFWIRGSIFTDYGQSYSTARNVHVNMWGAGFGFTSAIGHSVDLRLSAAWPIRASVHSRAGQGTVYFGVGVQF